jgi:hypothetical protein
MTKKRNAPAALECGTGRNGFPSKEDVPNIATSINSDNPALLEMSPFDVDASQMIGRDPRTIPADEWPQSTAFHVGMGAIRAKCFDCAFSWAEVRKCTATGCDLWPLRMGSVPKGFRQVRKQQKAAHKRVSEGRRSND